MKKICDKCGFTRRAIMERVSDTEIRIVGWRCVCPVVGPEYYAVGDLKRLGALHKRSVETAETARRPEDRERWLREARGAAEAIERIVFGAPLTTEAGVSYPAGMKKIILWLAFASLAAPALAPAAQEPKPEPSPAPVTYAVLFDGSKSLGAQFGDAKEAARLLLSNHKPGDVGMVARFVSSDEIRVLRDFTGDGPALASALDGLHTDKGASAVVDAVYVTAEEVSKRAKASGSRGAVVLLTDGEDRASYHTPGRLAEALRGWGVRVFAVGFTGGLSRDKRRKAERLLAAMAEASGGRAFFIETSAELPAVARSIDEAMRRP